MSNLTSLNVNGWDTSNVTDMSYMFTYSNRLTNLNLSGWNVCSVTNHDGFSSNSNIIQPNWGMSCSGGGIWDEELDERD
jgi:surface protein